MKEHHLQLNLAKTALLVFPATPTLQHDFTIQLGSSTIAPSASVRNLGNLWWPADLQRAHCKDCSICRFALHNIRKIRPFLTEHAAQLLVQALVISRLDYCNALLAGLPSNTIKPLQMIQNAAARLQRAQKSPCYTSLSPCTGYQLQLASSSRHWCLHIEQPQAQHPPTSTHYYESTSPPEVWDLLERRLVVPSQRGSKSLSRTFSSPFLAAGMIFPPPSGMLDPCQSSSNNWKLISFNTTCLHPTHKKKKKKLNLSLYLSLLPLLACTYLNNAWDFVLGVLPLSDCLFKMNHFMYSPIVSRFE